MVKVTKWMLLSLFWAQQALSQEIKELNLAQAYDLAQKNYPVIKQKGLVKQTADITIENLQKGYLPQLTLSGQASYQSEVTSLDVPIPGFKFDALSKDQYKLLADVNQLVFDGGVIHQQKAAQQLNADVEQQKIEVELYNVKDRINQLYLGVLYLDAQLKQTELIKVDLNNGIKRVEAQVNNGVALRSNLSVLKAELLKADQRTIELTASRKGLIDVLGLFVNQPLPADIQLQQPGVASGVNESINRPELKLYTSQAALIDNQSKLIRSRNLPKASLFVQGGYGKPGLNFLKNDFEFYYIGGIRFNWSLGGYYTQKKEKQLVDINKRMVDIEKETFLLNTNTSLKQQQADIDKLQQLIASDAEIIDLRLNVKEAAKAQLENGVITANDYLREVNAEDQARQTLITHQLQLLQAQINYQTISGNQ